MRTSQKQQVKNLLEYFRQIGDPVIENEIQCALKEIFSSLIETITQIIHTFYLYGKKSIVKNEFLKEITNSNFISKLCNI